MSLYIFLQELQKLKESSAYAIVNGENVEIDEFRKYLHVEREVEIKLKKIIIKSSTLPGAQLVLVCGNVGDGKSHILSYLHSSIGEEMSAFKMHNDATESHNPNETSNQTLYRLLKGFRDENLDECTDKIILAINLGTLSKFLEEYGEEFSAFKKYIEDNKILDTCLVDDTKVVSNFHHINFTDYHVYSLTENGAISNIITTIFEKIVSENKSNLIYKAYKAYKSSLDDKAYCPILYNYEFLFDKNNRVIISHLIIKAIIQSKEIVSLRSLLNFIYDIIVPVDLADINESDYFSIINKMDGKAYLSSLIPNYLFEHSELSSLFEKIESLDPCSNRNSKVDDILLNIMNTEQVLNIFSNYIRFDYLEPINLKINQFNREKTELSKLFIRLNYFSNYFKEKHLYDHDYEEYVLWLFHYNNNNLDFIEKIYSLVENAARNWNGDSRESDKVIINVGKLQTKFRVFKSFELIPDVKSIGPEKQCIEISRFTQEFTLLFKINDGMDTIRIYVDYSLFRILKMISKGYRPNKKDNDNYVYFVNSINTLINQNNSKAPLYIDEVNIGKTVDYKFYKGTFRGYKFEVI